MTNDRSQSEVGQLRGAVTVLAQDVDRNTTRLAEVADAVTEVRQLAESADAAARRLVGGVDQLTREVRALRTPTPVGPADIEGARVMPWLTLDDPKVAGVVLADLADWLRDVYTRYPDGALSECWAWHPSVVAELVTLREGWIDAYLSDTASAIRAMDWHDRWRPGVAGRVNRVLATCSLSEHGVNGSKKYQPPFVGGLGQLDELARWWASSHAAPIPAPDVVAEAAAARQSTYDRGAW